MRVVLPDTLKEIKGNPFSNCPAMKEIVVSGNHPRFAFAGGALTDRQNHRLICFLSGTDTAQYTVPSGIESIGADAFRGCAALTDITLPDSVSVLEDGCFAGCTGFTAVALPEGVKTMGSLCYAGCIGLQSVDLPYSLIEVGDNPFMDCPALKDIYLTDDHPVLLFKSGMLMHTWEQRLVSCLPARMSTAVTIIDGVMTVGNYAFYGCKQLNQITIPQTVTDIGDYSFAYCTGLKEIILPDSVETLGKYSFSDCTGLTAVTLGKGLKSIMEGCFYGCRLTEIAIPKSVKKIGDFAFEQANPPTLLVKSGSYAQKYAKKQNLPYEKVK